MLVQSFDNFDEVGDFDPATGRLATYRKTTADTSNRPLGGHFAVLGGTLAILYRTAPQDDALHLRVSERDYLLAATGIEWKKDADQRLLRVVATTHEPLMVRYLVVIDPPLHQDPTPFVEEEDFDFCLFLLNVWSDLSRLDRLYRS
jgi:hypothetical protein